MWKKKNWRELKDKVKDGVVDLKERTPELTRQARELTDKARVVIEEGLARSLDRTVRLAVTGFSRSGKTVFTMSMVHLLKHLREQPELVADLGIGEIVSVQVETAPALDSARFPYAQCIADLSRNPALWPEGTRNVSEIRITIRYRMLHKFVVPVGDGTRTLYVDIIDYPGEWLLDLPLLNKSYAQWSTQALALMEQPRRAQFAAKWRTFAQAIDPAQSAAETEELITKGADLFREYLKACRAAGLQFIQPGRFIMPGDLEGKLLLQFFPLQATTSVPEGSLIGELERRYEGYRKSVVGEFYSRYFNGFNRQVVLVDILTVLNNGQQTFIDTRDALQEILENFRYGDSNWWSRLFKPNIDRVLITATKADRVSRDQSPLLKHFLEAMLEDTRDDLAAKGTSVKVRYNAISALCCTKDIKCMVAGAPTSCIQGIPVGEMNLVTYYPGQVPSRPPADDDWEGYSFRDFSPSPGQYQHGELLDHLQMHAVIRDLIGDKL